MKQQLKIPQFHLYPMYIYMPILYTQKQYIHHIQYTIGGVKLLVYHSMHSPTRNVDHIGDLLSIPPTFANNQHLQTITVKMDKRIYIYNLYVVVLYKIH